MATPSSVLDRYDDTDAASVYRPQIGARRTEIPRLLGTTNTPTEPACEDVRCPACTRINSVPVQASEYHCWGCQTEWVWVICWRCADFSVEQGSASQWRCTACLTVQQSWRTMSHADAIRDAIIERRTATRSVGSAENVRRRGPATKAASPTASPRTRWAKRAYSIAAGTALLVISVGGSLLAMEGPAAADAGQRSQATCAAFSAIDPSLPAAQMQQQLAAIDVKAAGSTADVRIAAHVLGQLDLARDEAVYPQAMSEMASTCLAFTK